MIPVYLLAEVSLNVNAFDDYDIVTRRLPTEKIEGCFAGRISE
jgi:hypothetical protein